MIYITGDTHGDIDFDKLTDFTREHSELTRDDYIIIAGDFGGVWNEDYLDDDLAPYEALPATILFVDGNHENFDMLNAWQVDTWHGGKVHIIRDNIIHLMRGQVYELCGKTFFTFGGATSIDKYRRIWHESWWIEELPSEEELAEAKRNLARYDNRVNYIITHSCDKYALDYSPIRELFKATNAFPENEMLTYFEDNVDYDHWYFGHYHVDGDINAKKTAIYQKILPII